MRVLLVSILLILFSFSLFAINTFEGPEDPEPKAGEVPGPQKKKHAVKLYFVLPKDYVTYHREGQGLSCGDRVIPIVHEIETYDHYLIVDTLLHLFSVRDVHLKRLEEPENLVTRIRPSSLHFQSMKVPKYHPVIELSGEMGSKDSCELEGLKAQILNTLYQFAPDVEVRINGSAENFHCAGLPQEKCHLEIKSVDLTHPEKGETPQVFDHNPHVTIY